MDRFEAMSILIATVETGSFTGASKKLGIPLPTVSRKVADLEEFLHTRLLVRSTRRLALTADGAAYIEACRRILDQVNEAEQAVSGAFSDPRGELAITAPIVFGRMHVLPIVNEFLALYPEVSVRLALSDQNINLVENHIDLAVRIGTLPDSNMFATSLGTVCRVVCGSPDYFKKNGAPKTPADLTEHTCISFQALEQGPAWKFSVPQKKKENLVAIKPRLVVNTAEAAVDAAVAGVGLAHVLSYQAWPAYQAGDLKLVMREFDPHPVPVSLVHTGQRSMLPAKSRKFLEFAVPKLRKVLVPLTKKDPPALAKAGTGADFA